MFKIYRIPLAGGKLVVPMPIFASEGAAAMDFYSANIEPIIIRPRQTELIKLGVKVEIPLGYQLMLKPRSGLALRGITLLNSPATIDSDYRGEVGAIVYNSGEKKFIVEPFMRICQGEIIKASQREFTEVFSESELSQTARGEGGYNSTGTGIQEGDTMQDHVRKRAIRVGLHIVATSNTVRQAADVFGISKTTIHEDISVRLPKIHKKLSNEVNKILSSHKTKDTLMAAKPQDKSI